MHRVFRFCLKASQSPTHFNLHHYLLEQNWRLSRFKRFAHFSDDHLQFDKEASLQLEYKHLLAQLVAKHCPGVMPETYCINDQNWPMILSQLACRYYPDLKSRKDVVWILKPALLNNGKHIKIFQTLDELDTHFQSTFRLGGEHVLQRYLSPHLLRDKRKYSIRMFVIATNYAGTFLYPYGYYNVALHPFAEDDFSDLRSHLTNEHLQHHEANVLQIPTERFEAFKNQYSIIKAMVTALFKGLERGYPDAFIAKYKRRLAIFGIDFLVDATGRIWLLEANHGPCFPESDSHPLQHHLYKNFWQRFITSFVLPIAVNQPTDHIIYTPFELLESSKTVLK